MTRLKKPPLGMSIGAVSKAAGVSERMVRYYESIGLILKPVRGQQGFRYYSAAHLETLKFIRNARDVGLNVEQIGEMLALWRDHELSTEKVCALAISAHQALESRAKSLRMLRSALRELMACLEKGERPTLSGDRRRLG